jgi:chloride channel protein, CIC family
MKLDIRKRDQLRLRLGSLDDQLLLALLGGFVGIVSALIAILFRYFIQSMEWGRELALGVDEFEQLNLIDRLLLPIIGSLVIAAFLYRLPKIYRPLGVMHVIERVANHQGFIHWKNAVAQFILGGIAVASGQSVGREGPCVHLGAASASHLAQWMKLPNNSMRVMVACGVAAAIAASFDTPLAGVIFAMEVVLLEYALASFIPIILASVFGAVIARLFFGHDIAFQVPAFELNSLGEMPLFILLGLFIGTLSSLYIKGSIRVSKQFESWPLGPKIILAGVSVGLIACLYPEIMGIGYDTVNQALNGQIVFYSLFAIGVFKLLAGIMCTGLAMPAGVIGPMFVMGACFGGAFGLVSTQLFGELSHIGFYVLIGMAAMMSATLQAPLAALIALLELSGNSNILLPGMLTIIIANLMVQQVFKLPSLFHALIASQGRAIKISPLNQLLRSIGVVGVMEREFVMSSRTITRIEAQGLLAASPAWIIILDDKNKPQLLNAADLARFLLEQELSQSNTSEQDQKVSIEQGTEQQIIDLLEIPANRLAMAGVYFQANLEEALIEMEKSQVEAIYIFRKGQKDAEKIYGIMTRNDIEAQYRYRPNT